MKLTHILVIMFLLSTINCASATIITVNVHNNNTDHTFSSIQDAINHAQENDSIVLNNGTYSETLTINKSINLYSLTLDPRDVIIESNDSSVPVIYVLSNNVKINGITMAGQKDRRPTAGILIDNANNLQIQNNLIANTQDGLYITHSSGNHIQNNTIISNTEHGIYLLDSILNNLKSNNIHDNKRGLYLDESEKNTIADNKINNNHIYGIALRKSSRNTITQNQLTLNNIGLALTSSDKNTIFGNNASENKQDGLHLWLSNSNSVTENIFAENKDSGTRLVPLSSNNIFERNTFSGNLNGITIESTDNNIIQNNKFRSNKGHAIYHRYPDDKNVIKDNSFADNPSENVKFSPLQEIFIAIIVLTIIMALIAFYFRPPWWKAGVAGLIILAIIGLIVLVIALLLLTIIFYFPFESGLPGNNVYVEDLQISTVPLNETYSRVIVSMNLNYQNKDSFEHTNNTGNMVDNLPVFVQIKTSTPADGLYSDEDMKLVHEEQVFLEYLGSNQYEYTIDLESGKTYRFLIEAQLKNELPYPHPYYGEMKWEFLGGLSEDIDLK
jgi:parallel beta-helix repeat protein